MDNTGVHLNCEILNILLHKFQWNFDIIWNHYWEWLLPNFSKKILTKRPKILRKKTTNTSNMSFSISAYRQPPCYVLNILKINQSEDAVVSNFAVRQSNRTNLKIETLVIGTTQLYAGINSLHNNTSWFWVHSIRLKREAKTNL